MFAARVIAFFVMNIVVLDSCFGQDDLMRVHFIDVGQGDATLIEFPHGVMLVDAGGEKSNEFDGVKHLMKYLDEFFERRKDLGGRDYPIDLLAITHPHKDHTRAIPRILEKYPPANIIHNHQTTGSGGREQRLAMSYIRETQIKGYFIVADRAVMTGRGITNRVIDPFKPGTASTTDPHVVVLWGGVRNNAGWDRDDFKDENNHSLVIRVEFGDATMLFTGDLEVGIENQDRRAKKAGIERLLDAYRDSDLLDVDVYQAGHHGSGNGGSDNLMRAVKPEIAVISCGPPVRRSGTNFSAFNFGHPRKETIDEMVRFVSTDRAAPKDVFYFKRQFRPLKKRIAKSIYCTGWDGTVVLEGKANGKWTVAKLHGNPAFNAAIRNH